LGQHFLHHRRILERIADALPAPPGSVVLEIGPGQGSLTGILRERGYRVTAIEKDPGLADLVRGRFPAVSVALGDALELDWNALVAPPGGQGEPAGFYLIGNIPYNITSPLIARALSPPLPVATVFLVQEEVADRITASPGTSAYGSLSVGVQAVAEAERLFRVPAGAFHPRPRVDSAVIRLTPRRDPLVSPAEAAGFRLLVTGVFSYRRKQMVRALRELTGRPPELVAGMLSQIGVNPASRPEQLSPQQFSALYRGLIDAGVLLR
jgi:16S rRNA (adenine1518-N6/adenine1519-N6)-dimethyltransferase